VLVRAAQRGGSAVRLADIATISLGTARATIEHEGGQRRQVITANAASGANVAQIVAAAQAQVAAKVKLPAGRLSLLVGRRRRTGPPPRASWPAMWA
jgi:Cu/Ag efflux pump CusA